jgi:hypothetical protein
MEILPLLLSLPNLSISATLFHPEVTLKLHLIQSHQKINLVMLKNPPQAPSVHLELFQLAHIPKVIPSLEITPPTLSPPKKDTSEQLQQLSLQMLLQAIQVQLNLDIIKQLAKNKH